MSAAAGLAVGAQLGLYVRARLARPLVPGSEVAARRSVEVAHFSHGGSRFVLGNTASQNAIWDRAAMQSPVGLFPRTSEGRAGFLIAGPPVAAADPDPCALVPPGVGFQITTPGNPCYAYLSGPSTEITENIFVNIRWHTTVEAARQAVFVGPQGSPPTNYGDVGWEGPEATGTYGIEFARGQYFAEVLSGAIVTDARVHKAQGYAAAIDAAIIASLGCAPTPSSASSPSSAPATATLTTGLACGTDLRVVRCTASPGGALPDAELVYEWTFDGFTRPETGSTMELDWVAERLATGDHTVLVTLQDSLHPNVGPAVSVTGLALGMSVRLTCSYGPSGSQYAVQCVAAPQNAFGTAVLTYEWSYLFIDQAATSAPVWIAPPTSASRATSTVER